MIGDRIGYVRVQWENQAVLRGLSPSGKERAIYWGAQGGYSFGHHCGNIREAIERAFNAAGGMGLSV